MTTPISSSIPYCSVPEFFARKDRRQLGDWVLDTGQRETGDATLSADQIINTALLDASGMVEMYALRGNRYSIADLQALTGAGRNLLVKIVVELAYWALKSRRLPGQQMPPEVGWAFTVLDDLALGAKIFGLQEVADAGNPKDGFETEADLAKRGNVPTVACRFFGRRAIDVRNAEYGND